MVLGRFGANSGTVDFSAGATEMAEISNLAETRECERTYMDQDVGRAWRPATAWISRGRGREEESTCRKRSWNQYIRSWMGPRVHGLSEWPRSVYAL